MTNRKFIDIAETFFEENKSFECSPMDDNIFVLDAGPDEIYYFNREGELVEYTPNDLPNNDVFRELVSRLVEELNNLGSQNISDVEVGNGLGNLVIELSQEISQLPLVQTAFKNLGQAQLKQVNEIIDAAQRNDALTKEGKEVLMLGLALVKGPGQEVK